MAVATQDRVKGLAPPSTFVRGAPIEALPAPAAMTGAVGWAALRTSRLGATGKPQSPASVPVSLVSASKACSWAGGGPAATCIARMWGVRQMSVTPARAMVCSKGYRETATRSMGRMPWASSADR